MSQATCVLTLSLADSTEVQAWLKELDGWNIPDLSLTVNGSCAASPAQASDAANRGWWTCGGYVRDTGECCILFNACRFYSSLSF
jgi:hypothetical protein